MLVGGHGSCLPGKGSNFIHPVVASSSSAVFSFGVFKGGGEVFFSVACVSRVGLDQTARFFSYRYSRCSGLGAVSPTLLYALSALLVFDRSLAESVRGAACVRGVWEAVGPDVRFE